MYVIVLWRLRKDHVSAYTRPDYLSIQTNVQDLLNQNDSGRRTLVRRCGLFGGEVIDFKKNSSMFPLERKDEHRHISKQTLCILMIFSIQ